MKAKLRIIAWIGMPGQQTITAVSRKIGMDIECIEVSSNEEILERLNSDPRYDVIFCSDYLIENLIALRRLKQLEHHKIPNLKNLSSWALKLDFDPGNNYSVPTAFGTTGYIYRRSTLEEPQSWGVLFNPGNDIRVGMLSEIREVFGATLLYLGHGPNPETATQIDEALDLLNRQVYAMKRYDSDDFVTPIINKEVDIHQAWSSPSAAICRANNDIAYVVPEEGAVFWVTAATIPIGVQNESGALDFISAILEPEVAKVIAEQSGFSTPNSAAQSFLSEELRIDPNAYPDENILARCQRIRHIGSLDIHLNKSWEMLRKFSIKKGCVWNDR